MYIDTDLLCHFLMTCKQILQNHETEVENINFICNILENIWCTLNLENKVCLCIYNMRTNICKKKKPYSRKYFIHFSSAAYPCLQKY